MSCCGGSEPESLNLPPILVLPYTDDLQCLEFTVPPGSPAIVHSGGSIEFPPEGDEPPIPLGYVRDEENPYLLHPTWVKCRQRLHGLQRSGDFLDVLMVCHHPDAKQGQPVTPEDCANCPFHS